MPLTTPNLITLGIESSCDETGVALYQTGRGLLAHALYTQVAMHNEYGGVVPELASRDHVRRVIPLVRQVMREADISLGRISAIAYTQGPGLGGALLVGASVANALAYALDIPTIGIHHLEGHLLSPLLSDPAPEFPFVALLVSGGHTQLMRVDGVGRYTLLGETVDDAAGEAFDKSAKLLGLGYPGGPGLAKLATSGRPGIYKLPRPMLHSGNLDFSFSGLKTAVLTLVKQQAYPHPTLSRCPHLNPLPQAGEETDEKSKYPYRNRYANFRFSNKPKPILLAQFRKPSSLCWRKRHGPRWHKRAWINWWWRAAWVRTGCCANASAKTSANAAAGCSIPTWSSAPTTAR